MTTPVRNAHPCDVHKVAGQCGIKILKPDVKLFGDKEKVCFCPRTLKKIGQQHGDDHLRLVLRLIVESEGNTRELNMITILAVSNVVLSGLVEIRADLFDEVDLGQIRAWSRAVRPKPGSTIEVMTTALLYRFASPEIIMPKPLAEQSAEEIAAEQKWREIARKGRENAKRRLLRRYAGAAANFN